MLRLILKMDGCSSNPVRDELMAYAEKLVLVVLHPRQQE
jgi:hypothetical protein